MVLPWYERAWVSAVEWAGMGRVLLVLALLPLAAYVILALGMALALAPAPPLLPFLAVSLVLAALGAGLLAWGRRREGEERPPGGEDLHLPE